MKTEDKKEVEGEVEEEVGQEISRETPRKSWSHASREEAITASNRNRIRCTNLFGTF